MICVVFVSSAAAAITSTSNYSESQPYATSVQLTASVPASSTLSAELLPVDVWGDDDTGNTSCPMVKDEQAPPLVDPLNFSPTSTTVGPGQFSVSLSVDPTTSGSYLFCAYADDRLIETDALTVSGPPTTLNVASTPTAAGFSITASGNTPLPAELLVTPVGDCIPEWASTCVADAIDASAPVALPAGPFSFTFPPWVASPQSVLAQLAPPGGGAPFATQTLYLSDATVAPPGVTVPFPTPAPAAPQPTAVSQTPAPATLPTARLRLTPERVATARRRGVRADLTCGGACTVRLVLSVSHVRRHGHTEAGTRQVGTLTIQLRSAGTTAVAVPLSAAGRQLLRGVTTAQVAAAATLSAPGVQTKAQLVSATVTLGR